MLYSQKSQKQSKSKEIKQAQEQSKPKVIKKSPRSKIKTEGTKNLVNHFN